jgi:hypothetical protein
MECQSYFGKGVEISEKSRMGCRESREMEQKANGRGFSFLVFLRKKQKKEK